MLRKSLWAALVAVGVAVGYTPAAMADPPQPPTHGIAWGKGDSGQLGNGGYNNEPIPVQVRKPELGFTEFAAGELHSLGIAANGTVWAWGQNTAGQLGDGQFYATTNEPVKVVNLTDVVEVAAGYGWSMARKSDGTVWGWGANHHGQLGLGWVGGDYNIPQKLPTLNTISHIEAGWFHGLAIRNGSLLAWGGNASGQLGDGTTQMRPTPIKVAGVSDPETTGPVYDVAAGLHHTMVIRSNGTLLAWGANDLGQLGNGLTSTTPELKPVPVLGRFNDVRALAAGCYHSYLVDISTVYGWGDNSQAQVATTGTVIKQPQPIPGVPGSTDVAAGCRYGLALTTGRQAFAWGHNNVGQLGTGVNVPMPPRKVVGADEIYFIAAGPAHGLAAQATRQS